MKKFHPRFIIIVLLRLYQRIISPLFVPSCRFYPTCSSYAIGAFNKHGVIMGFWLLLKRIIRCNPFYNNRIFDPVP